MSSLNIQSLPPVAVDKKGAVEMLAGRDSVFDFLIEKGYLELAVDKPRVKLYRPDDVRRAFEIAIANGDDFQPTTNRRSAG